jgi:general stress protein 26
MEKKEPGKLEASLILEAAVETIKLSGFCFLITNGETGLPNARLMQPFPLEDGPLVWFGASALSRKVQDLKNDSRAVLAYQNLEENAYVTLTGNTELVDSLETRRQYWMENWFDFFPGGPESDDYILIRFQPERIEVMNFTRRIHPPPFGLAAAVIERSPGRQTWSIVEG